MKLKETRILDAEGARYACIANDYCTCCDCEEYDRILNDAAESSRKPGGITVDDLARIAEAIKARSETDDDVPATALQDGTFTRTMKPGASTISLTRIPTTRAPCIPTFPPPGVDGITPAAV